MRIGISCNRFGRGGGLERYALDLADELGRREGIEVHVYARGFDADRSAGRGVREHRINVSWLPGKLRDHAFSTALHAPRSDCDLLIACNRVRGADLAICGGTHRGYLAARGRAPGLFDRLQVRLESAQYADASVVVAHSRQMLEEVRDLYGIPEDRIRLLYPPADGRRFRPVDEGRRRELRARHGFGDEIVLLFPSSGHERKGLAPLAEAVARAGPGVTLAVVGRPVGRHLPGVRELGYSNEIEELYQAADFTALASDYEPFGLVGVESVLCGTPLLFADTIGCLEVIRPAAMERFRRTDSASLDAALRRAMERVRAGAARIAEPRAMLDYDPGLAAHVDALLDLARHLPATRPTRSAP